MLYYSILILESRVVKSAPHPPGFAPEECIIKWEQTQVLKIKGLTAQWPIASE